VRSGAQAIGGILAALGLALGGPAACSRDRPARVVIGELDHPALGLLLIAQEQGFFDAEGVEVVHCDYPSGREALAALLAGEVDLAAAYETPVAIRVFDAPGLRILTTLHSSNHRTRVVARTDHGGLRTGAYPELSMLVTRDEVIASRRDALVRVLRALARAERFAIRRPAEARASLERALPSMPPELVGEAWSRAEPQLGLSHVLLVMLEREAEWQRARSGAIGPMPDFGALLAPALLVEVEPEAVTLLDVEARAR
jgi:ABC-type nitrate/sulfonate/bicarbonate transport system substrate-binding protein